MPRDGVPPVPPAAALAAAYGAHGLSVLETRPATPEEVRASGSSWAKRLRAATARPVTVIRFGPVGVGENPALGDGPGNP